jgi:hypothetical protein
MRALFCTKMTTSGLPQNGLPPAQGLYDPRHEHDACGVGFVCHLKGKKSHKIVLKTWITEVPVLKKTQEMEPASFCNCLMTF